MLVLSMKPLEKLTGTDGGGCYRQTDRVGCYTQTNLGIGRLHLQKPDD